MSSANSSQSTLSEADQKKAEARKLFSYDLDALESQLTRVMINITSDANGIVSLTNPRFVEAKNSFINSKSQDLGPKKSARSVMSFAEVEKSILAKLEKNSQNFTNSEKDDIKAGIDKKRLLLEQQFVTEDGIKDAIIRYLKDNAIKYVTPIEAQNALTTIATQLSLPSNTIQLLKSGVAEDKILKLLADSFVQELDKTSGVINDPNAHSQLVHSINKSMSESVNKLIVIAGANADITRTSTQAEMQAFGRLVANSASVGKSSYTPYANKAKDILSNIEIPFSLSGNNEFKRQLTTYISNNIFSKANKLTPKEFEEKLHAAVQTIGAQYLSEKIVINPKGAQKLTERILEAKIPLSIIADPNFATGVAQKLEDDNKLEKPKLKNDPTKLTINDLATIAVEVDTTTKSLAQKIAEAKIPLRILENRDFAGAIADRLSSDERLKGDPAKLSVQALGAIAVGVDLGKQIAISSSNPKPIALTDKAVDAIVGGVVVARREAKKREDIPDFTDHAPVQEDEERPSYTNDLPPLSPTGVTKKILHIAGTTFGASHTEKDVEKLEAIVGGSNVDYETLSDKEFHKVIAAELSARRDAVDLGRMSEIKLSEEAADYRDYSVKTVREAIRSVGVKPVGRNVVPSVVKTVPHDGRSSRA